MQTQETSAGVIGSGSFGLALSKLLAYRSNVLLYTRRQDVVDEVNRQHKLSGTVLSEKIRATMDFGELAEHCKVLFPAVPSDGFREMMREISPFLEPRHFIIHCTKGFDIKAGREFNNKDISRLEIRTMSEVITEESVVLRTGCLSGPNLAREILEGQPTATLIASEFREVIKAGQQLLSSAQFFVFGSHDLIGAELAGALKNVIALGSGILAGRGLGKNMQAMLITRGLHEMIQFGHKMGAQSTAFLGTAGIGDLIATATSKDSRNFTCGFRIGSGESVQQILDSTDEVVEGVRTLKIAMALARHYQITVPITEMLHKIVFEEYPFEDALKYLMRFPYKRDVGFT